MTAPDSDGLLADALRAGDHAAFERLYGDYHAPIYNLCARIVGDREEAKDLTQEVFLKAFSNLPPAGAEPLKLRPWLFRVATNACLNHLRSRKGQGGDDTATLAAVPSRVDTFEQAQTVALVEASLGQMSERYRTALVLKDLHGLPPAEIAEVMEVTRPTADVLVHRARSAFKGAYAKLAGEGTPAPASLGLVLVPLSVPAALRFMPPMPHAAPAAHPVPHATPHPTAMPAPHGAGLLGKLAATSLATKLAIGAAAAVVVVGGAVAGQEVRHAQAHTQVVAPGTAWHSTASQWTRQAARWSLYANWSQRGWPSGWNSGHWAWNSRNCSWTWQMSSGWKWSGGGGQMAGSSGWSGGNWTMSSSHSGSAGWSSGGKWSGSGSSSRRSGSGGSWSGSGSKSGGGWSGGGGRSSSGGMSNGSSGSGSHGWSGGSSGGSSGHSWSGGSRWRLGLVAATGHSQTHFGDRRMPPAFEQL